MASITNKADPLPKLRVTRLSCKDVFPQLAQRVSTEVDGDDEELAGETDFDDSLRGRPVERDAADNALDFARPDVALALGDLPRKDDVFEIKDGEVVIVKFLSRVGGNKIIECANQVAKLADCCLGHSSLCMKPRMGMDEEV